MDLLGNPASCWRTSDRTSYPSPVSTWQCSSATRLTLCSGHDSYILGQGDGQFSVASNFNQLRFTNPPRRDVAQLRGGGWLVIAYPTDNPGAWLMHCHIAFHVGMGLSVQFLERKSQITLPATGSEWYNNCNNWAAVSTDVLSTLNLRTDFVVIV